MIERLREIEINSRRFSVGDVVSFHINSKKFGPVCTSGAVLTLPGRFIIQEIESHRRFVSKPETARVYFQVRGLDKIAGTFFVFVSGRPYRRFSVRWRPYRVQAKRTKKGERSGSTKNRRTG